MKKNMIYIIISIIILFSLLPVTYVQAADGDDWVQDAFNAANNFLGEDPTLSENGEIAEIEETMFEKMKMIVKAINRILLVLLFGLSAISLGVIGIRYILAGSSPHQKEAAKHITKAISKSRLEDTIKIRYKKEAILNTQYVQNYLSL